MNHGLKINNNVLEITLPEEVHIDKVIVNRQIFSQRMQVCKSCKYHGLEGYEEPCVSCEVGNSNYVPSVEQEERTEKRTETHACDCISRQAAIESLGEEPMVWNDEYHEIAEREQWRRDVAAIEAVPSAQPQIIHCNDCKHHWTHRCMDSMPTEVCDLNQTFYDPNIDFCSLAERRTDE